MRALRGGPRGPCNRTSITRLFGALQRFLAPLRLQDRRGVGEVRACRAELLLYFFLGFAALDPQILGAHVSDDGMYDSLRADDVAEPMQRGHWLRRLR